MRPAHATEGAAAEVEVLDEEDGVAGGVRRDALREDTSDLDGAESVRIDLSETLESAHRALVHSEVAELANRIRVRFAKENASERRHDLVILGCHRERVLGRVTTLKYRLEI